MSDEFWYGVVLGFALVQLVVAFVRVRVRAAAHKARAEYAKQYEIHRQRCGSKPS